MEEVGGSGEEVRIRIKPFSEKVAHFYQNHGHFHEGDAGLDLFVPEEITFHPGETVPIHHQIACETEDHSPFFLIPRSSISKTPLRMSNSIGLIDGGYRGEITAYCDNIREESYIVREGERLFQLVSGDCSSIRFEIVPELEETTRGAKGFGSTGL